MSDYLTITCPDCGTSFKASLKHIEARQNKVICLKCKSTISVETEKAHIVDTDTGPQTAEVMPDVKFYDLKELHTPIGKINSKRVILFAVIALVATVTYAIFRSTSCSVETESYLNRIGPIIQEWDKALEVANITPRIIIYQSILQLEAIKRKAQNIEPRPCVREAHIDLLDYMSNVINMFSAFASDSQYMMLSYKKRADSSLMSFSEKLSKSRNR